jgi:A/G-specific adenine glycosylase
MRRNSTTTRPDANISTALLRWYRKNGRSLPWRNEKDPYKILVSEVMLQQTQVSRVLLKYPEFLAKYPTFRRLAQARVSDVIRTWRGMGYNNRAIRLRSLAQTVVRDFGGRLPETVEALQTLPGIGRYTSHAIACFAFGQRVPIVDTNIARVFNRLFPARRRPTRLTREIWTLAEDQLPRSNVHDWNQGLMDLGAMVCTVSKPRCESCPLKASCPSAHTARRSAPRLSGAEPGRKGIPNRIYRGKAVEALRNLKRGGSMNSSALARAVIPDYSARDRRWFAALLQTLERDGLVRRHGRTRISLPD